MYETNILFIHNLRRTSIWKLYLILNWFNLPFPQTFHAYRACLGGEMMRRPKTKNRMPCLINVRENPIHVNDRIKNNCNSGDWKGKEMLFNSKEKKIVMIVIILVHFQNHKIRQPHGTGTNKMPIISKQQKIEEKRKRGSFTPKNEFSCLYFKLLSLYTKGRYSQKLLQPQIPREE